MDIVVIQGAQNRQLALLFEDPDFNEKCQKWLAAIHVPTRERLVFGNVAEETSKGTYKPHAPSQDNQAGKPAATVAGPKEAPTALNAKKNHGSMQPAPSPAQVGTDTTRHVVSKSAAENSRAAPSKPTIREKCMAFLNGEHDTPSVELLQAAFNECPDLKMKIVDRMSLLGAQRGKAN